MTSQYRLLAIDVDGTLVNSNDELSSDTCEALRRAGEAGIRIVLATGRRYGHTLHLVEPLGIKVPLVTAGGALVKDPADHRTLYRAEFDQHALCRMMEIIDRRGYDFVVNADTYTDGFDFYQRSAEARHTYMSEYFALNPGRGRVRPDLIDNPPSGIFAGFAMGSREEMVDIEQRLHGSLPGWLSTHVLRSPRYHGFMCELAPASVTKWSAIRRLAAAWGIDEHAICAVGDDVNDIAMIRAAGLGVAMGNALPEVKAAADRVADTHDNDGLVQVVEWLFES